MSWLLLRLELGWRVDARAAPLHLQTSSCLTRLDHPENDALCGNVLMMSTKCEEESPKSQASQCLRWRGHPEIDDLQGKILITITTELTKGVDPNPMFMISESVISAKSQPYGPSKAEWMCMEYRAANPLLMHKSKRTFEPIRPSLLVNCYYLWSYIKEYQTILINLP